MERTVARRKQECVASAGATDKQRYNFLANQFATVIPDHIACDVDNGFIDIGNARGQNRSQQNPRRFVGGAIRRWGNRSGRYFVAGRRLRINHAWAFSTFVTYTDHLHASGQLASGENRSPNNVEH
jgi:hypothetical protein